MTEHVAIVGPTAVGKSALALELARRDPRCEIVSLDSMQVYRGMDVGTAKPTTAERAAVVHHLVDVVDPAAEWSVARTQQAARAAVADIEARGGRAVLVGGTGLYVQAVVDDFEIPGEDLAVRAELEAATSAPGGLLAAWDELRRLDPVAATRIDEHNQRRIVRALEVIRVTGRPFSSFGPGVFGRADGGPTPTAFAVRMIGVWTTRAAGAAAITARVEAMRDAGLVAEVERLLAAPWARSARQAIGYKEVADALEAGTDLEAALDLVVRRTRSFARRQRMWFRRDPRVVWIRAEESSERLAAADLVCGAIGGRP